LTTVAPGRPSGYTGTMPEKRPKRPRDVNQWAKHMVDLATGQAQDAPLDARGRAKDAKAIARGRAGGKKGGKARSAKLTPEQRIEIARLAAQTRWKKSP
jgi:hypothetical protein